MPQILLLLLLLLLDSAVVAVVVLLVCLLLLVLVLVGAISPLFIIIIIIIIIDDDSNESCRHIDHQWSQSIYCCVWFMVLPVGTVTIVYTAVAFIICSFESVHHTLTLTLSHSHRQTQQRTQKTNIFLCHRRKQPYEKQTKHEKTDRQSVYMCN